MEKSKTKNNNAAKWFVQLLIIQLVLILFIYPFVHELGHSIAVIFAGGKVTGIVLGLFSAHMNYDGVLNASANGIVSIMGMLLPYLCFLIYITFVKKNASPLVQKLKWGSFFVIMGSITVWIVLPIMSYFSPLPKGDDVTQALKRLGCEPYVITVFATMLFVLCLAIFLRKAGSLFEGLVPKKENIDQDQPVQTDLTPKL